MTKIVRHYTPSGMSPDELKRLFISEKGNSIFEQIKSDLQRRIDKSSNQHYLILGPRGIGKSHLLANLYYAIKNTQALNAYWIPLWLSEEEYSITSIRDLSDRLLEEISGELFEENNNLKEKIEKFKKEIEANTSTEEVFKLTTAFIKDLCSSLKKRFVVIIENFNRFLRSIDSYQEKILRALLMNETALLFVASAPTIHTYLREVADPKNALYNLFDVHYLGEFSVRECRELLKQRCSLDNNNPGPIIGIGDNKLEIVYIFTGGNPRFMLLFYQLATSSENTMDIESTLTQLVEQLTPYFQSRTEILSDQQRKILIEFARSWQNLSPAEVGKIIHLPTNQVTAQIRKLVEYGFIKIADKKGQMRGTLYELSEKIYRYWYHYRISGESQWIEVLFDFISGWLSVKELKRNTDELNKEFNAYDKINEVKPDQIYIKIKQGVGRIFKGEYKDAFEEFDRLLTIQSDLPAAYQGKAFTLTYMGDPGKAVECCNEILKLEPGNFMAHYWISICQVLLNSTKDALFYLEKALPRLFKQEGKIVAGFLKWYIYFALISGEFDLAKAALETMKKKMEGIEKRYIKSFNIVLLEYYSILVTFLIKGDKNLFDRQPLEFRQILKEMSSYFLDMRARRREDKDKAALVLEDNCKDMMNLIVITYFKDFVKITGEEKGKERRKLIGIQTTEKQIKILAVTVSPEGENYILYEQEQDTLLEAFKYFDREQVFLDMPDPVKSTLVEIREHLEDGHHDILHITAHGGINENGEGILSLEDHQGRLEQVTGKELLGYLKPTPKIVILSACHSARKEPDLLPVARALYDAGIETVLGMKKAVSHMAAIEFNSAFFKTLCEKKTVKQAFEKGKEAIFTGEQQRLKEIPGWEAVKEYEIPQLLAKDENLTVDYFSDHRIKAPGQPESHHFLGAKYLERGFIGRRRVLRDIFKSINNKEGAVVLKGPGGIGKSTLTTRTAANLRRKGYDFIVVRGETTIEKILEAISQKAADSGLEGAGEVYAANIETGKKLAWYLDQFLLKEKLVIILDNFEENQDEQQAGEFKKERLKEFLWFFRNSLRHHDTFLMFSTRYTLPGFDSPDITINIPEFSPLEFRKMLLNRRALKRLDSRSVKTLRQEIGGNPWALELLDRIAYEEFKQREFTWEQLKDLLPEMRERIIEKKGKGDEFTPVFLERLLGYLSEVQRLLLDILAIYRNPVPVEAVTAHKVSMKREDRQKLGDLSLLECIDLEDNDLYYVHRLTAQYLLEQMKAAERKRYHQKAAGYFESLRDEEGKRYVESYIESRWHYLQAGEWNKAAEITFRLEDYLSLRGYPQWALELLRELKLEELDEENRSAAHSRLGLLYQDFGEYNKALEHYNKALKIDEKRNDAKGISSNLHQGGRIYQERGDYDAALIHYQKSMEISEKIGDIKGVSSSLHQVGNIYYLKGDYEAALTHYQKAKEVFEKIGDIKGVSYSLHQIGMIYQDKGDYEAALRQYEKAKEISEKIGDIKGVSYSLHQIGMIYQYKGNYEAALTHYQKSMDIKEKIGDIAGAALSHAQMGSLSFKQNKFDTALKFFIQAYLVFAKIGAPNANQAKQYINRVRENLPEDQFNAILKEFNLPLDVFDKTEEDKQEQLMDFLTAITKAAVSASTSEKSSDQKEKLAAQLSELIEKLPDAPEAQGLKNYFQLLLAVVNGEEYQSYLEKVPEELKELFEKIAPGKAK